MLSIRRFLFAVWVNTAKDLHIWARQWQSILAALVMPLTYVLVAYLGAAAVGASPVALVVQDQGTIARQVAQALHQADVFRISDVDAETAQQLYNNLTWLRSLQFRLAFLRASRRTRQPRSSSKSTTTIWT